MTEVKGKLLIIGGAEDKKGPCLILRKFLELSGGKKARLVILTAATDMPLEVGRNYQEIFNRLGCEQLEILDIPDRKAASGRTVQQLIAEATGVFFTGGDQLQITSALGGTKLIAKLQERYRQGLVIAGTSAGASAMSSTMIVEGDSEEAPHLNTLKMAPGLGFLNGAVIDQHFAQRGRIGRLLTAVGQNPSVLGLGIDEDTALLVEEGNIFIWGSQTVTILDGEGITHTNASMIKPDQYLALTHVSLHVLPHGYGFCLRNRTPIFQKEEIKD